MKEVTDMKNHTSYFENDTFDWNNWDMDEVQSSDEVRKKIESFSLRGKTIQRIRFLSYSFFHSPHILLDIAYSRQYKDCPEPDIEHYGINDVDDNIMFYREAEIDDCMVVGFDDGSTFEISTGFGVSWAVSMNQIPWNVRSKYPDCPYLDASILFSSCIGRTITDIEVVGDSFKTDTIMFILNDGTKFVIEEVHDGWYDVTHCEERENGLRTMEIPFSELRKALNEELFRDADFFEMY